MCLVTPYNRYFWEYILLSIAKCFHPSSNSPAAFFLSQKNGTILFVIQPQAEEVNQVLFLLFITNMIFIQPVAITKTMTILNKVFVVKRMKKAE